MQVVGPATEDDMLDASGRPKARRVALRVSTATRPTRRSLDYSGVWNR